MSSTVLGTEATMMRKISDVFAAFLEFIFQRNIDYNQMCADI